MFAGPARREDHGVAGSNCAGGVRVPHVVEALEVQRGLWSTRFGKEAGENTHSLAVSQAQDSSLLADGPVFALQPERFRADPHERAEDEGVPLCTTEHRIG